MYYLYSTVNQAFLQFLNGGSIAFVSLNLATPFSTRDEAIGTANYVCRAGDDLVDILQLQ